jgi:hypothetical protein
VFLDERRDGIWQIVQKWGMTVLHWAAENDHVQVVEALLRKEGIKVNEKDVRDLLRQSPPFTFRSRPYIVFVYI